MYARLRGIKEKKIPSVIDELAKCLTFEKFMDKVTKSYRYEKV